MINPMPVTLEAHGIRLEPLAEEHADNLIIAASDGELWQLWFTSIPRPEEVRAYVTRAQSGTDGGHMLPWAVRELTTGTIIGSTRYHDIVRDIDRVEVG